MAKRTSETFAKRQKEIARKEKRQKKLARRQERKRIKEEGGVVGEPGLEGIELLEGAELLDEEGVESDGGEVEESDERAAVAPPPLQG